MNWSEVSRRLIVICVLAVQLLAACVEPPSQGHSIILRIEWVTDSESREGVNKPRAAVEMRELEARVPRVAAAVESAKMNGAANIEGQSEVENAYAFFDEKFGRVVRGPFILEVGADRFLVMALGP